MIYRCRWCERGYCEDCLDWDKVELVGENLIEYELLGYPAVTQAFYICCPQCTDYHKEDSDARAFCAKASEEYEKQHKEMMDKQAATDTSTFRASPTVVEITSRAESLTDATTADDSGVSTPKVTDLGSLKAARKAKQSPGALRGTFLKG